MAEVSTEFQVHERVKVTSPIHREEGLTGRVVALDDGTDGVIYVCVWLDDREKLTVWLPSELEHIKQ